jgi:hypothetical protein
MSTRVQGTEDSIFLFWNNARVCNNRLSTKRGAEDKEEARSELENTKLLLRLATTPVDWPHKDTLFTISRRRHANSHLG